MEAMHRNGIRKRKTKPTKKTNKNKQKRKRKSTRRCHFTSISFFFFYRVLPGSFFVCWFFFAVAKWNDRGRRRDADADADVVRVTVGGFRKWRSFDFSQRENKRMRVGFFFLFLFFFLPFSVFFCRRLVLFRVLIFLLFCCFLLVWFFFSFFRVSTSAPSLPATFLALHSLKWDFSFFFLEKKFLFCDGTKGKRKRWMNEWMNEWTIFFSIMNKSAIESAR